MQTILNLKNIRYNGNLFHSATIFLIFCQNKIKNKNKKTTQKNNYFFAVHFVGPSPIASDTKTRIVARCCCRIVSSHIHVTTYRILRVGRSRWRIVPGQVALVAQPASCRTTSRQPRAILLFSILFSESALDNVVSPTHVMTRMPDVAPPTIPSKKLTSYQITNKI